MIGEQKNLNTQSKNKHIVVLTGATLQASGMNNLMLNCSIKWKQSGYRVTVICQDRNAKKMTEVDQYIQGQFPAQTPKLDNGKLRVVVPDVNGVISVYSSQHYQEFENIKSKPVQQMSQEEIQTNINMTAKCLRAVCQNDRPFKVLANYILLSPIIALRGLHSLNIPFDMTVIGPAMMYSVKPYPHLRKWVLPAFKTASRIYQLTQYVKKQFYKCFQAQIEEFNLESKIKVFMPGLETKNFQIPQSLIQCQKQFIQLVKEIKNHDLNKGRLVKKQSVNFQKLTNSEDIHQILSNVSKKYNVSALQQDILQSWLPYNEQDETIIYVGALINKKGMGQLLAIAPKLIKQRPALKFIFCGTGPYSEHMHQLIKAYQDDDIERALLIAEAGDFITEIDIKEHFIKIDKSVSQRIIFAGLINEQVISKLLPLCTIYAATSRIFKPCSMLIVEAMCCGLTPVCNDHSWTAEVLDIIEQQYPQLISVTRAQTGQFYKQLPNTIIKTLDFIKENKLKQGDYREKIRQIAVKHFSWEHTAAVLAEETQMIIPNT